MALPTLYELLFGMIPGGSDVRSPYLFAQNFASEMRMLLLYSSDPSAYNLDTFRQVTNTTDLSYDQAYQDILSVLREVSSADQTDAPLIEQMHRCSVLSWMLSDVESTDGHASWGWCIKEADGERFMQAFKRATGYDAGPDSLENIPQGRTST